MEELLCKGGCGKALTASNKSGFAWGHASGCPPSKKTESVEDSAPAESLPEVQMTFNEDSLERIWQMLPLSEKGLAIATALTAVRE